MKHVKLLPRVLVALLMSLLLVGLVTACDGAPAETEDTPIATAAPTAEPATAAPTEAPTAAPTEAPTEAATEAATEAETVQTGWKPDMGTFNEGKVTYVKNDDGTVTATPAEGHTLGLDVTDKVDLVGIFYSIWFDYILGTDEDYVDDWHNITEALAGERPWGPSTAFHYWAKPALGYYTSSNKEVIRTHMTQLYTAGVDFIILDHTNLNNAYLYDQNLYKRMVYDPMAALYDTIMEMRAEGLGTPYVVVWCGPNDGTLYRHLYDHFYNQEKWLDCFVYWDGLPLLCTTGHTPEDFPLKDENLFKIKKIWAFNTEGQWSFLNPEIKDRVYYAEDGTPEQVGVCTAAQRSYMGTGTDKKMYPGDAVDRKQGKTWYVQWYYAFQIRPKIVTLTWWNEWAAQRLPISAGQYAFTDNFNAQYSRDIEPMEGGHGDQYYQWMIQYISAYKGHLECPVLVEEGQEESAIILRERTFRER